jgi:hypothetical protein
MLDRVTVREDTLRHEQDRLHEDRCSLSLSLSLSLSTRRQVRAASSGVVRR